MRNPEHRSRRLLFKNVANTASTVVTTTLQTPTKEQFDLVLTDKQQRLNDTINARTVTPSPKYTLNLNHKPSKLDLIDSSFTSFPLAPPRDNETGQDSAMSSDKDATPEPRFDSPSIKKRILSTYLKELKRNSSRHDEDITLVEDYIPMPKTLGKKRVSIVDFKQRMKRQHTQSTIYDDSGNVHQPSIISGLFQPSFASSLTPFGTSINELQKPLQLDKFNETDLKYCVICEKPLYDLSSLIQNCPYKEIVCSDCRANYEVYFKVLEQLEAEEASNGYESDDSKSFVDELPLQQSKEYQLIQGLRKIKAMDDLRRVQSLDEIQRRFGEKGNLWEYIKNRIKKQ
ncbi:BA75_01649T0 [Komagataella pastoris]|uniref:BA75_01649T0 n=1 Tax=Komagataella pastoris TaxID=4922 RepID=A0A1B2J5V8_PICPA|nr:BA75_01649T0 [Komagataella pastoris]